MIYSLFDGLGNGLGNLMTEYGFLDHAWFLPDHLHFLLIAPDLTYLPD